MTLEVWLDEKKEKEFHIDASNLFTFDNSFVLTGAAVKSGKHVVEVRKKGAGPVYFNACLTYFSNEELIKRAGTALKVNRRYYKVTKIEPWFGPEFEPDSKERYIREELSDLATLKSGDRVEVELEIDSDGTYEYLLFEDPKPAGFEPVDLVSGYTGNGLGAYMELHDDRVCFFMNYLWPGKRIARYQLRAEIPGKYSALPAHVSAMYAPELKANSDEMRFVIVDR